MWASIVAEILKVLGPLILAKLEEWLKRKLSAKAAEFDADGIPRASLEPDSEALLRAVRADLWFFETRKRRFLDAAMESVPAAVSGRQSLSESTRKGLSALAVAAN